MQLKLWALLPILCYICWLATACTSKRAFSDARCFQDGEDCVVTAPYVVVGRVKKIDKTEKGVLQLQGASPSPGTRVKFSLAVEAALRGAVSPDEIIEVIGYEFDSTGTVGAPIGVSGLVGDRGVYCLRQEAGVFRPPIDCYRTWFDIRDSATVDKTAGSVEGQIWKLLTEPYEGSDLDPMHIQWMLVQKRSSLLASRTIELLKEKSERSPKIRFRLSACIFLNETFPGYGGDRCISQLLADPSNEIPPDARDSLGRLQELVVLRNDEVRSALQRPETLVGHRWRGSDDPEEIRRLLVVLSAHPDPEITRLAKRRLATM